MKPLFEFSRFLATKATPEFRDCWRMILYHEIQSIDDSDRETMVPVAPVY